MADKKFTLLELHLGDGTVQIGPATLDGGDAGDDATESGADDATGNGGCCPGRKVGKLLLALLVLALFALGLKKALGGGEDLDELEDLADLDEGEA